MSDIIERLSIRSLIVRTWTRECHDQTCLDRSPHTHHMTWFGLAHLYLLKLWMPRWPEHLADFLLSLPGIAIVELPKPVVGNDWDWCAVLPGGHIDDLITESGLLTTDEARSKAAALLAAAQAAERATE